MKKPTIVFVHGAFVTRASFEPLMGYFKDRGFEVLAPAWPFHGQSVPELRDRPEAELGKLGLENLTEYYAGIIRALPEKPIIIGHSFGGLLTQLLMDRGLGLAGIAINSAGAKGIVAAAYPTTARSIFGILSKPWRKTFMMSFKEFQYAFVNTLSRAEQERAYREHVVPETTRIFFQGAVAPFASSSPFKVDFNNGSRGPLLMIAGEVDRIVPASLVRKNYGLYNQQSGAVTEYKEFSGRSHWIIAQPGWEEVADFIDHWLKKQLPAYIG
ncbi:alpha/beta hydrolase [Paenibacillus sp. URB8-2]|uniref:alpha/beta hydrolase n=1 Tax=Paenibacillus sp. URB8-2 TaxID=2741301 RepID=UPI0015C10297|nr:alpha/beta hydrolase [Paenibacillus sp. URB8-2]BCG57028.1 alpha/beta hydrolase [Paenibacillus sp. URB8-2]